MNDIKYYKKSNFFLTLRKISTEKNYMSIRGHNLASFSLFVKHLIGKSAPYAEMVPVNMADIKNRHWGQFGEK